MTRTTQVNPDETRFLISSSSLQPVVVNSSREERRVRDAVVGGWSKERLVGLVSCVCGRRFWFGQETEAAREEEGGAL
jgi:hypothetical protein